MSLRVERASSEQATVKLNQLNSETKLERECTGSFDNHLADGEIIAIAHRVVHGGDEFRTPIVLTAESIAKLEKLSELAPLHNPINMLGVNVAKELFASSIQIAVFDTAFHSTLPRRARAYALPIELQERYSIRRYGFHGTSHEYVAKLAAAHIGVSLRKLRLISLHLGSGCSATAIEFGSSTETSMGFTPLEGLVMGTRCGDIDPGLLLHIAKKEGLNIESLDQLLNKKSGLLGLSAGRSSDMRDLLDAAAQGDESSQLAIHIFCHRATKYVGAYSALMGGVDAIIFTAGIGENSAIIRRRISQRLGFLGAILDEDLNYETVLSDASPVVDIAAPSSPVRILVIKTNEQRAMLEHTQAVIANNKAEKITEQIPVGVSARHIHLTNEAIEKLFGEGYQLKPRKMLSQPGQFAAEETVTLHGPKNTLANVRILGPARSINQVEISRTDEFFLGIDAPVRASGNIEGTPGITLEGPKGKLNLDQGLICAWRHIHMTPEDATKFRVKNGDVVNVEVSNLERGLVFGNVLIRVSAKYVLEMHIDTDEANAAEISSGVFAKIIHRH
ncbi:UNVERIFIED_CONTAM: hypothetical protein GTU68_014556 [Idotea baltica]|nr:hypothetical protein [Idotea baltica]